MLTLKPNCECCAADVPPDSLDARSCSFECTFCKDCSDAIFGGTCPNCGGELLRRPRRPAEHLGLYPASTERFVKDHQNCGAAQIAGAEGGSA